LGERLAGVALVDAVLQALFGIKAEVSARVEGWFPDFNIVAVRDEDERALVELGFQGVYVGGGLGAACDGSFAVRSASTTARGLPLSFEITSEHARAFQEGTAIFNLWPYFREFVQSHLVAMALSAFTAPFLRIQPKPVTAVPEPGKRKKSRKEPKQQ